MIINERFYPAIEGLSDEQIGRLFRALMIYQTNQDVEIDSDIKMPFLFFINDQPAKVGAPKGNKNASRKEEKVEEVAVEAVVEKQKNNQNNENNKNNSDNCFNCFFEEQNEKVQLDDSNNASNASINNLFILEDKKEKEKPPLGGKEKETKKKDFEKAKLKFYDQCMQFQDRYPLTTLNKFFEYWSEPNISGTKMRYQLQRTWDLDRRIRVWTSRERPVPAQTQKFRNEEITTYTPTIY